MPVYSDTTLQLELERNNYDGVIVKLPNVLPRVCKISIKIVDYILLMYQTLLLTSSWLLYR